MSTINKIIITCALFLILVLSILFFIIFPTIRAIKELNQYIYQEQKNLEVKFQSGKKIKETRQNFLKIKPYLSQINNIFLIEDKKIEFFSILEKIAQKYNLKFNLNLIFLESPEKISLKFDLEGEYFNFLKYLIDLERLDYYININEISINEITSETQEKNFFLLEKSAQKETIKGSGKIKAILLGEIYQKKKEDLINDKLF
ncbi:MAG: hypothetical protein AAB732_02495 [Patescibacteria group bacterium]